MAGVTHLLIFKVITIQALGVIVLILVKCFFHRLLSLFVLPIEFASDPRAIPLSLRDIEDGFNPFISLHLSSFQLVIPRLVLQIFLELRANQNLAWTALNSDLLGLDHSVSEKRELRLDLTHDS